jgi:lipopolysaccharide export system ATP-binding protein
VSATSATAVHASKATEQAALEVEGLTTGYGRTVVVRDVSLSVPAGAITAVLGPNGAGKTTSFYMIVGLVRADAGQITIDGEPIAHMPIHRRARMGLSYLPQEASIFRKLTVEENVRAVLELQREPDENGKVVALSKKHIEERLSELLTDLRVDHLRDSPALALSGGERRRCEIARAVDGGGHRGVEPFATVSVEELSEGFPIDTRWIQ